MAVRRSGGQGQQVGDALLESRAGAQLVIIGDFAIGLAAQAVAPPAVGDASSLQGAGQGLAVGLGHVAAVGAAAHVDQEFDAVLAQQGQKGSGSWLLWPMV